MTIQHAMVEPGDCPMLVWSEDAMSRNWIGRLPNGAGTTLFVIERFTVGGFRLLGAFIPDAQESRFHMSLEAAKVAAQEAMNEWVTTFTRGWK